MRELLRREYSPAGRGAAPLTLLQAQTEAERLAHLLRLGFDDDALDALEGFVDQIGTALGEAARGPGPGGRPAGGPLPQVQEVLKALQMAALCQGRGDLIGLADLLEHRVAVSLKEAQG